RRAEIPILPARLEERKQIAPQRQRPSLAALRLIESELLRRPDDAIPREPEDLALAPGGEPGEARDLAVDVRNGRGDRREVLRLDEATARIVDRDLRQLRRLTEDAVLDGEPERLAERAEAIAHGRRGEPARHECLDILGDCRRRQRMDTHVAK